METMEAMGVLKPCAWRCPKCGYDVRLVWNCSSARPPDFKFSPAFFSCGQGEVGYDGVYRPAKGDPLSGTGFACRAKWAVSFEGEVPVPGELIDSGAENPEDCLGLEPGAIEVVVVGV